MNDFLHNSALLALVGTLFGGVGLKIIDKALGRTKEIQDQSAAMRNELRKEIDGLREQLKQAQSEEQRLEAEIDRWRGLYYDVREEKTNVITELTIMKDRLESLQKSIRGESLHD